MNFLALCRPLIDHCMEYPKNMNIPVPSKESEVTTPDVDAVTLEPTVDTTENTEPQKSDDENSPVPKSDDSGVKLAELINSKKYNLNIKEKRTKPLLVISLGIKRKKKLKNSHKTIKKVAKPKNSKKQMTQAGLLAVLVIGLVLAIDIGWLDIGIKLPFSLFGN